MKPQLKKTLTHIGAILIMLIVSCIYFHPALNGDIIIQGDMQKVEAMAHSQNVVADSTGSIPNWNPGMFSGMPGYQIAIGAQKSVLSPIKSILILRPFGLERNIGMVWLYLIGFYVAMIALGCSPWLALLGAVAFGLGSYNIIIIEAGHITKGWAISMIAPILAAMVLSMRSVTKNEEGKWTINWRRMVWGFILFTIAAGLQITFNHIQITFYTLLGGLIVGVTYLVYALREKWIKQFLVIVGILVLGCLFAAGSNFRHLTVNQEYSKVTMRGGNEITVKPSDIGLETSNKSETGQTDGLDINYAFSWSYGIGETYTLLVPGAMGGGSGETVAEDSEWARRIGQTQAPLYWGDQPFTSGPVYFGAIVVFLFLLGCFVVKGPERWWIIAATVLAIVMSWGRHCMFINEFLFNNLPLYNKFRTPSISLVLANATMAIMATLALKSIFDTLKENGTKGSNKVNLYDSRKRINNSLYWSVGIIGGLILLVMIIGKSKLSFQGVGDEQYKAMLGEQWPIFQNLLISERQGLFIRDSWRSLAFVLLAFVTIWLFVNEKIKKAGVVVAILAILTVVDLWGVDKRYLNENNFIEPSRIELRRNQADLLLDQVAATNGDRDYRVYDLSVNTFNDSRPSAFHNEIGGYSAAKLRRYQDLIDFYLGSQKLYDYVNSAMPAMTVNPANGLISTDASYPVLDMLNARYIILPMQNNQPTPIRRNSALGPCWLVNGVQMVDDVNAEILALNEFNPATTAIVDKSQWPEIESKAKAAIITNDSVVDDKIVIEHTYPQTPDHLTYKSHTSSQRIALFSEIFYAPDWRAYIDGKPADYFRANYVLRAMIIPAGDHTIEFVNEAPTLHKNDNITLIISLMMILVMGGALFLVYRKR